MTRNLPSVSSSLKRNRYTRTGDHTQCTRHLYNVKVSICLNVACPLSTDQKVFVFVFEATALHAKNALPKGLFV